MLQITDNPVCIDFNPWSGGWDRFVRSYESWEFKFSADYTQYDAAQSIELLHAMYRLRLNWLPLQDRMHYGNAIRNWYLQLSYGLVCVEDGNVYQKMGGMPSGVTNTITDNSIINFVIHLYAYFKIFPSKNF